nr:MAG TPA: DNA polymerase B [Caudoviricetes sp.]
MRNRNNRYFVGDFETTVYKGQVNTEVWASACVEMFTEDVHIFHSIGEQFDYFVSLDSHIICYYHNLKFDGSFWLSYLMVDLGLKQATEKLSDNSEEIRFLPPKDMPNNTFTYSISSMGQWYRVTIKIHDKIIELRDSLKLLPFSVKKIGKSFGTKHKKLEMEYTGFRYAGCEITPDEQEYIKNDILVVKEALEIMFTEGHKKLTIGSCCLAEYKKSVGGKTYKKYFPQLYDIPISSNYGEKTAGDYIHNSYHGGWCYLAKGKERRIYPQGTTADVNSLYPSMMSSESGNMYPIGEPTFWKGNYIPDEAVDGVHYYFVRFKTRFYLKPGMLPFIQIKNTLSYRATEMLETSDRYNKDDGKYYTQYYDIDGNLQEAIVTLTMTMIDFKLFVEHYELVDFEILDGCYFNAAVGIFDEYIEKYKQIKIHSKGAQRELAKLFLNNLYGKMASSQQSNFKVAYIKEDKTIGFYTQLANDKEAGYIAVGSAITSYARNFTIRAAQQNYYGADKDGFIYADTDSIHCSLPPDQIKGIKVHPTDFCCWKLESTWDVGFFVRQKTYVEHVIAEDCEPIEKPYYNFKCAGMPERCKELFIKSMKGEQPQGEERDKYTKEELQFLETKRTINDFNIGLKVPGKLLPKRIRGGVLLVDTTYEMR